MNKYTIEDNIDFFSLLNDENDINYDITDKCLITNEPLIDKYVTLMCGHKFNYIPLFNDLLNHKKKFNIMETHSRLNINEIRCPYCRNKQTKLMPYYDNVGVDKINGVNYLSKTDKSWFVGNLCVYNVLNPDFNESLPVSDVNMPTIKCDKCHASQIQTYDYEKIINYNDNNYYCWEHKKSMIKHYKLEEKEKAKQEKKAEREKAKLEKKKAKEDAKKKAVEDNEPLIQGLCLQILKFGPNKGNQCCGKVFGESLCKRHLDLKNKNSQV